MPKKVVFLDRDGTINIDHGYVSKIEDWQWCERAVDGLKNLQAAGFVLVIITNQSGIAAGYYTTADMRQLHMFMQDELAKLDVIIDAIAFCPHGRDSTCDCRKPQPGMAKHIEEQIGAIDYALSWTIGDKTADLGFGQTNGTQTALVRSRYWQDNDLTLPPDLIVDSLYEASLKITSHA